MLRWCDPPHRRCFACPHEEGMSKYEPAARDRVPPPAEGRPHPHDLGVTPSPQGELYVVGEDLVLHLADWRTVQDPHRLPRANRCGLDIAGVWKLAVGYPRRPISAGCAGPRTNV